MYGKNSVMIYSPPHLLEKVSKCSGRSQYLEKMPRISSNFKLIFSNLSTFKGKIKIPKLFQRDKSTSLQTGCSIPYLKYDLKVFCCLQYGNIISLLGKNQ